MKNILRRIGERYKKNLKDWIKPPYIILLILVLVIAGINMGIIGIIYMLIYIFAGLPLINFIVDKSVEKF